jgi:hypothetical protein
MGLYLVSNRSMFSLLFLTDAAAPSPAAFLFVPLANQHHRVAIPELVTSVLLGQVSRSSLR